MRLYIGFVDVDCWDDKQIAETASPDAALAVCRLFAPTPVKWWTGKAARRSQGGFGVFADPWTPPTPPPAKEPSK